MCIHCQILTAANHFLTLIQNGQAVLSNFLSLSLTFKRHETRQSALHKNRRIVHVNKHIRFPGKPAHLALWSVFHPAMATYNNKHWLLTHIRNSFVSTDDTGLSEAIMLSEDMPTAMLLLGGGGGGGKANAPNKYEPQQQPQKPLPETLSTTSATTTTTSNTTITKILNNNSFENNLKFSLADQDYACYPGLDLSDDEEVYPLAQSFDIQMDQGMGFIQRSNTAQKLDQMNLARKRAAKIKNVKCQDQVTAPPVTIQDVNSLFVKKIVTTDCPAKTNKGPSQSLLAELLILNPKQPTNKYLQYARFDGTGQQGNLTKKIRIFLTMLPETQRNYPMPVCVLGSAKIQEFIGLICYKASLDHPEVEMLSVSNYGLYITEENGEVDSDFPPLDLNEPCSKFCFSHLALVKRKDSDVRQDARTMSLSSKVEAIQQVLLDEQKVDTKIQDEALALIEGHNARMEAPLYKSFNLEISRRGFFNTAIQLGISAEKLEIDPKPRQNSKFFSQQKAITHNMDTIVWCEIIEEPAPDRTVFKIVYCPSTMPSDDYPSTSPNALTSVFHNQVEFPDFVYRSYKFVTDIAMAQDIVDKVRNIIEVRSSPARRDYLSRRSSGGVTKILAEHDLLHHKKKPFKKLFN